MRSFSGKDCSAVLNDLFFGNRAEMVLLDGICWLSHAPGDVENNIERHPGPRVAPQMSGMGLLEAIPAEDILAWADPATPMATGSPATRKSFGLTFTTGPCWASSDTRPAT
jgi:hypothetical protein